MKDWLRTGTVLAGMLASGLTAAGQSVNVLGCVERWELPSYSRLAREVRVEGTVLVTFTVGSDGSPEQIVVDSPNPVLWPSLFSDKLASSRFQQDCVGRRFTLTFKFTLQKPERSFAVDDITLVSPDTVEISTSLPVPRPTQPSSEP